MQVGGFLFYRAPEKIIDAQGHEEVLSSQL
jgi:hypothetical protein